MIPALQSYDEKEVSGTRGQAEVRGHEFYRSLFRICSSGWTAIAESPMVQRLSADPDVKPGSAFKLE